MHKEHITPTRLRKELFKVLDRVAETGVPVRIHRGKFVLKLMIDDPGSRLARITAMENLIVGDPDKLLDSGKTWSEEPCL